MKRIDLTGDWETFDYDRLKSDACVIRYGAFGDMIQASSVLPALKEKGLTVTMNTTEKGYEIVKNNPHIDILFVQKKDQVPNERLHDYWALMKKPFAKFYNLSESVERSLLACEGDKCWSWTHAFRDLVFGHVDYLDGVHAIAECMDAPRRPFFFPNAREDAAAKKFRAKLGGGNRVILWALSGSSLHKTWPHIDTVFARLMVEYPDVKIVTVGDELCRMLDFPWENEKRVVLKTGEWSIRKTLAFLPYCNMVVGPETGVMNAASFLPMPKILFLSHSSRHNIGGKWLNTQAMEPEDTPCFPCHKLHFSFDTCNRYGPTGVALCASNISPERVYSAIKRNL